MASALVPVVDVVAFLGDFPEDDTDASALLETLIDDVEALFLAACGRPDRAFGAADTGRVEVHDGTGSARLYLERDITALTSVKLGHDVTDPEETLDVADKTALAWQVGRNRLVRLDGRTFGTLGAPDFIQVTYDAAAELPRDAALAITRVVASVWRQLGSEDVTAERIGPYDATFRAACQGEPLWQMAVRQHREVHV